MRYIDLLIERQKVRGRYIKNINKYLQLIKKRARKILGNDTKVYLFGSFLKGNFGPNSDIDILVVSPKAPIEAGKKSEILVYLKRGFSAYNPFEIHLATPKIFENWYKKFIKKDIKEI
jgi:predicted nucleotidyltransferase